MHQNGWETSRHVTRNTGALTLVSEPLLDPKSSRGKNGRHYLSKHSGGV